MKRLARRSRRGFSLVEAMIVVVVVALLVPPSVSMLRQAQVSRVDSTNTVRATMLSGAVLEQVLADASSASPSLGMAALSDSTAYLDTATTGLKARMASVTSTYQGLGVTWSLAVGGLVASGGSADADPTKNIYRAVTVTVSWKSARTGARTYTASALVTDLTP